jgi:hypothetical protein
MEDASMRTILAAGVLIFATSAIDTAAAVDYPWCARYGNSHGGSNCGFVSWEQCQMALSGNGGSCVINGFYVAAAPREVRHPRRERGAQR